MTAESFKDWKVKFDKEMARKKTREEEERLKALSAKEREEYKKLQTRYTGQFRNRRSIVVSWLRSFNLGRQLFERDRSLAASDDAALVEEGTVSVDISQYDRSAEREEEEEEVDRLEFSDSD